MSGNRAGPRSASQRANSGPDCNVEYANDSVMTPASVVPAGSTDRSTSSHTAPATGHRLQRSVSSATAAAADATVTTRRAFQSSSVNVNVARSSQYSAFAEDTSDPTATSTPGGVVA